VGVQLFNIHIKHFKIIVMEMFLAHLNRSKSFNRQNFNSFEDNRKIVVNINLTNSTSQEIVWSSLEKKNSNHALIERR